VGNPGLQELLSPPAETEAPVKTGCLGLRVEHRAHHRAPACALQHGRQQRSSHSLPAPILQHRHAPDASVGEKARRTDRIAHGITGDRVLARVVPFVPFELARDLLLVDEHSLAHRARERQRFVPSHDANGELCRHERLIIRVDQ